MKEEFEMKRLITILLLVFPVLSVMALTGSYGNPTSDTSVLIAYEPTRFKDNLVEYLIEELEKDSVKITVVDHKEGELEPLKAEDFDMVFITNSGATAKVRPWVKEWLKANGTNPDNVFVHTTQITEWIPQIEVDGTTSASLRRRNQTADLAADFARIIRNYY